MKPRDLRSNDKKLKAIKVAYENTYRDGFLSTKRGEMRPADKDEAKTVDVSELAKAIMSWHCQRPNTAYNENKLFDKHFEQLFKADHSPKYSRIESLDTGHEIALVVDLLELNEVLLAVPSSIEPPAALRCPDDFLHRQ